MMGFRNESKRPTKSTSKESGYTLERECIRHWNYIVRFLHYRRVPLSSVVSIFVIRVARSDITESLICLSRASFKTILISCCQFSFVQGSISGVFAILFGEILRIGSVDAEDGFWAYMV